MIRCGIECHYNSDKCKNKNSIVYDQYRKHGDDCPMDESAESIRLIFAEEIRRMEERHNFATRVLEHMDYDEIMDYLKLLRGKDIALLGY